MIGIESMATGICSLIKPTAMEKLMTFPAKIHLIIPVGKGRCIGDVLPHTFNIGVFKSIENISTTIKHILMNLQIFQGCNVAFDASACCNFQ